MSTIVERNIRIPNGRVIQATIQPDGSINLKIETFDNFNEAITNNLLLGSYTVTSDVFRLVEASKLSLDDKFLQYIPKTANEKVVHDKIISLIKEGNLEDFYRPICDPSVSPDGKTIYFKLGEKPAVGYNFAWWRDKAKSFAPYCRLGTPDEYIAFIATLIKTGVSNKIPLETAWDVICNNSLAIGNYLNSRKRKTKTIEIEPTGTKLALGYYDLANTRKILAVEKTEFTTDYFLASGSINEYSNYAPIALVLLKRRFVNSVPDATGWIVCDRING